jgi:hypothetical protein
LGKQLDIHGVDAGEVAARPSETGDEAGLDRVAAEEDDRDRRGRSFRRQCRQGAGVGRDQIDLAADEVDGQCGHPIKATLSPAVFDRHILAHDVAGFAQSLAERGQTR